MDVITIIDSRVGNEKKGDAHEFAVGFKVNPKALADQGIDLESFIGEQLLDAVRETILEHLEYIVDGQVSALDATRQ